MTLLIVFGLSFVYFLVGLRLARAQYKIWYRRTQALPVPEDPDALVHTSDCYLRYRTLANHGCSCRSRAKYRQRVEDLRAYNKCTGPEPGLMYAALWPLFQATTYIKSAQDTLPSKSAIAALEAEFMEDTP